MPKRLGVQAYRVYYRVTFEPDALAGIRDFFSFCGGWRNAKVEIWNQMDSGLRSASTKAKISKILKAPTNIVSKRAIRFGGKAVSTKEPRCAREEREWEWER